MALGLSPSSPSIEQEHGMLRSHSHSRGAVPSGCPEYPCASHTKSIGRPRYPSQPQEAKKVDLVRLRLVECCGGGLLMSQVCGTPIDITFPCRLSAFGQRPLSTARLQFSPAWPAAPSGHRRYHEFALRLRAILASIGGKAAEYHPNSRPTDAPAHACMATPLRESAAYRIDH